MYTLVPLQYIINVMSGVLIIQKEYLCHWFNLFDLVLQQIAFKNLVQRNRQTEQQANRPPPPNSIIHLPFIIVNTSKKTVIDCSISNDKYVILLRCIHSTVS